MTRGVLRFNLNDPDDLNHFDQVNKVKNCLSVLFEFQEEIRKRLKYSEMSTLERDIVQQLANRFYELLEENDVNMNELYR